MCIGTDKLFSKTTALKDFELSPHDFGSDFAWGISTAAYQIEGAFDVHDKGMSIWDHFTAQKGTVFQGHHGRTACDFYNTYESDILLLKKMNVEHYRFSLSWSRLLPNGTGQISEKGVDFYDRIIDFCMQCGITPWITLYHWDLPLALQRKGGWTNREIVSWFGDYVTLCAERFGDRVKNWMVLNEPMVFTGAGYFLGVHAPGSKGLRNFLPAVHHAVLCQALGGRILRSLVQGAMVGTTFSCSQITPYRDLPKDHRAAKKADALLNRLFLEPSLGMGYPMETVPILRRLEKYMQAGDAEDSTFNFDFIGIQNYTREVVRHSYTVPYLRAKIVKATQRDVRTTLMGWEVYPPSIYQMIAKFNGYMGIKKIIITENGAAFNDRVHNGQVHDPERTAYIQEYLRQVHRAKMEGMRVHGYFVWTLMDNFEWAEGYHPRFGLVYVDFKTQERIIKSSGKWFGRFLGSE
ncbi:MAG: GH1 family beta-glucosidase [Sediminicola sp.]